jgi:Predicted membrane protein (DUF2207) N-terminal domain
LGRAHLALALVAGALVVPWPAAADITATPAAHGVFTLERNGVLDVLERVSVTADAPTAATWQVTMQRGELFAQPSLYMDGRRYRPGDGKRSGTFRISRGSRGVRFDWLQPHGTHTARLGYRLALFGTAYSDAIDLHVPLWESGWPVDVGTLGAALELPRVPRRRAIVWLEPRDENAVVSTAGRAIRVQTRDVGAGDALRLRAVLPRSVLAAVDGLNVANKPGLEQVLAERGSSDRTWWPWAVAAGAVALLSLAVVLRTTRSRRPLPR